MYYNDHSIFSTSRTFFLKIHGCVKLKGDFLGKNQKYIPGFPGIVIDFFPGNHALRETYKTVLTDQNGF